MMVLVNLKPATLAGVVSEGMILCAEDAEGNLKHHDTGEGDARRCGNLLEIIWCA